MKLERALVIGALAVLCGLSWLYLVLVPMPMAGMEMPLTPGFLLLRFVMWFVMMAAMMIPSNLPAVLLFQRVVRQAGSPTARTLLFAGGYVAAWAVFSVAATALQTGLSAASLVNDAGALQGPAWSAGLLLAVGVYQWVPLKNGCLTHCRTPMDFLAAHFRPSAAGSMVTGLEHGLYCVGCCWMLMLLLFVGGVMNLLWIAGITLIVVVEKLLTRGRLAQRLIGSGFVAAAVVVLAVRPL